jgi:hypothetical protein
MVLSKGLSPAKHPRSSFAADWRIVDLGIMVEAEFGIPMSADKALSLKTVGDWRAIAKANANY